MYLDLRENNKTHERYVKGKIMIMFGKKYVKKAFLALLVTSIVGSLMPNITLETLAADSRIATMDGESYWNYNSLVSDLKDKGNKTVTIDMLRDWDYNDDDRFKKPLNVPRKCNLTFNMHGHIFNRRLAYNYDFDGELIYLYPEATLTINGYSNENEKNTKHTGVSVFTDIDQSSPGATKTITGACLAGGKSITGTGGIYIDAGKDITLNDVTIAGCMAKRSGLSNGGYGGGIIITESDTNLILNNSTITGCYAGSDGGAIYAQNDNDISIKLNNSHLDKNYANSDGGAINMDGENVSVVATGDSSINNNKCSGYGGGVYFWNDEATVKGEKYGELTISGNSASHGGGIYADEETTLIKNIIIENNSATKAGGGIYVDNDNTQIDECKITGNDKQGVYVDEYCDEGVIISGKTVIKNNKNGNLTLYDKSAHVTFKPSGNIEWFRNLRADGNDNNLEGMNVRIGYIKNPTDSKGYDISNTQTYDYSDYVTSDNGDYVVTFSYKDTDQDNGRRLRYIKRGAEGGANGYRRVNPPIGTIHTQQARANSIGKVYVGGYTSDEGGSGTQYELRELFAHHSSNDFYTYYTDGYFFNDSVIYNNHLATASWSLASAGGYLNGYEYDYKHAAARQFMADIGCPDQMIYVNDANTIKPGTDTIGMTIGSKVLQEYDGNDLKDTDYTLIAVAFRGHNYEKEWASNVLLGDGSYNDGEALGFTQAADQAMDSISYYINRYGLKEKVEEGKVKFWLSGFSRAGAATNLTSKRIIEKYCYKTEEATQSATGNEVFAYPLEAPQGGTDKAEKLTDKTKYYSIHNIINTGDIVPNVGPKEMGFKRYGVDHYIPGENIGNLSRTSYLNKVTRNDYTPTGASAISGITSVTTYSDNKWLDTKKDMDSNETDSYKEYVERRENMVKHLATINHNFRYTDYFHPYATSLFPDILYGKEGDFDGARLEDYIANFFPFLQQEAFDKSDYRIKYSQGIQAMARAYFAEDSEQGEYRKFNAIYSAVKKFKEADIIELSRFFNVLGDYFNMDDEDRKGFKQVLWDFAEKEGCFNELKSEEIDIVKNYWSTIIDAAFNFADGDWRLGAWGQGDPVYPAGRQWVNGNIEPYGGSASDTWVEDKLVYSLTLYFNINMIIDMNHDRLVGSAWTRTYDSYYSKNTTTGEIKDEVYKEYKVNWVHDNNYDNYSVDEPSAVVKEDEEYTQLKEASKYPDDKYNYVDPQKKVLLDVGTIHDGVSPTGVKQGTDDVLGEAIYYELYDVSDEDNPSLLQEKTVYRGGVDLPLTKEGGKYKIVTHARSLGKSGKEGIYFINTAAGHKVTVDNASGTDPITNRYQSKDQVTITANPTAVKYFTSWQVKLLDKDGEVIKEDIASTILNGKQKNEIVTFTLPEDGTTYEGSDKYPANYGLYIIAKCNEAVQNVATNLPAPKPEGTPSPQELVRETDIGFDGVADARTYPVVWTYTHEGKTYPATDTIYGGVDYIATITMPKDQANRIVFAPTDSLHISYNGNPDDVKENGISIARNDGDGSATITIQFKTTSDAGPVPPSGEIEIDIKTWDLNLDGYIPGEETISYSVHPGDTVTITAPEVTDEMFFRWNFDEDKTKGIRPVDGADLTSKTIQIVIPNDIHSTPIPVIDVQYIPVIKNISAKIKVPEASKAMQMDAKDDTLAVTITNEYQIHPDYVDITWAPEPIDGKGGEKVADYLVNYAVKISIVPKEDAHGKYIYARMIGGEYTRTSAIFNYSESATITINGNQARLDRANNAISVAFPMTEYTLEEIYQPSDVVDVPYENKTPEQIKGFLPSKVQIGLDDGSVTMAAVSWGTPTLDPDSDPDPYASKKWNVLGEIELPHGVKDKEPPIDHSVTINVFVKPAESVKRAIPSVEPGYYLFDQSVALVSETKDVTIYWTTNSSATIDDDYTSWNVYDGSEVQINREDATQDEIGPDDEPTGRKQIPLLIATTKDGMRPDGPRKYVYIFVNEVKVPQGHNYKYSGEPKIGVSSSEYYTLEAASEGVTIDDDGNAVATDEGTYEVTAIINDGFRWEIIDPDTKETTYTTDDQTVTFSIAAEDPPKPGPTPPGPTPPGPKPTPTPDPGTNSDTTNKTSKKSTSNKTSKTENEEDSIIEEKTSKSEPKDDKKDVSQTSKKDNTSLILLIILLAISLGSRVVVYNIKRRKITKNTR